jgi:lysosomal Pro-X carboxypeptidase
MSCFVINIFQRSASVFDMFDYPPGDSTLMNRACYAFQNDELNSYERMVQFFDLIPLANQLEPSDCGFDMSIQMPGGSNATISVSDWTGAGFGKTGLSWDFACCTELIVRTGFSQESMFYPREWSLDWLTEHCQSRFGVSPTPYKLVDTYGFDDLSKASKILFTNGLKDGWSASSILESPNDDIIVINMPNGGKFNNGASHFGTTHRMYIAHIFAIFDFFFFLIFSTSQRFESVRSIRK